MKFRLVLTLILTVFTLLVGKAQNKDAEKDLTIATGGMPNLIIDKQGRANIVYGSGDSIMYIWSDNRGTAYAAPALVSVLRGLAAASMRGPQIASTSNGLLITACNKSGDIFSFIRQGEGKWVKTARINYQANVAREQFMALSAEGLNSFIVWLDLRNGHNQIYGAKSKDGGLTWSKNIQVYASPDLSVCECCKPSVAIRGTQVYVMFRNWLKGNRDLYWIQSTDGGNRFGEAKKLGTGSWALNGCPMDGGGLVINDQGALETVWRRKSTIYACSPGQPEQPLGEGKSCTIESVNGKNVYAWVENGDIVILKPLKMPAVIGRGSMPVIKAVSNNQFICVWQNEKKIHSEMINL
jgi:hypothetical protein